MASTPDTSAASTKGASAPSDRPVRVLLLEDNSFDAELMLAALARDGMRCEPTVVRTRAAFIEALRTPGIDLVLADYSVPGYDGSDALAEARALRPEVPFLFVSGAMSDEGAVDLLRRGATDYVLKHRLDHLATSVRRALREYEERIARARAVEHATRLQSVTAALGRALAPGEVARISVDQGIAALDATTGACWLAEHPSRSREAFELASQSGYRPEWLRAFARITASGDTPISEALRTGEPVWLESRAEYRRRFAISEQASRSQSSSPELAVAVLPLALDERRLGVLSFTFDRAREFAPADRALIVAVARQCTQALDRARLYEAEADARQRIFLLASASEVLASSLDYETTLQNIADLAMPFIGDFGFFDVVQSNGEVRRIARAHQDAELQDKLAATRWMLSDRTDINLCALSTGRAAMHPDIDEAWMQRAASSPEHLEGMRALGFGSMLTVPLIIAGTTRGALTLFFGASQRRHTADDLVLAEELARRAATALESAELYRQAQESNRIKDEFLAMVSHELRTPMTSILGWSSILLGRNPDASMRRGLEVIDRNARAQARLIDDVLEVSRIVAGKLQLETSTVDVATVVNGALDTVGPMAQSKGVALQSSVSPDVGTVQGDADRLQQVVWNLACNAVKFTPPGGVVSVEAEREGTDAVRICVKDTGQGISEEFLPHVFERFRQADSSTTRAHGGLGLGLAIARHLVDLHGGVIRATSEGEGKGAMFTVVLPATPG